MSTQLEFKISAGLKNIIGKELIREEHTAIFELVKNSYDAYAKKVTIIFHNVQNKDKKSSKIFIIDDGEGMSYDDILNKWLFVGYSSKKPNPDEVQDYRDKLHNRKRFFAGAKGIGRFSADRLGANLNLYTKTNTDKVIHHLKLNWGEFEEKPTQEFQTIVVNYVPLEKIPIEEYLLKNFAHGTILEISSLNDDWDRDRLLKLRGYLQRLINPSQDPNNQEFQIELVAKEFLNEDKKLSPREVVNGAIKNIVFEKLNIKTTQIKCDVTKEKITTELIDKGTFIFKLQEDNPYDLLAGISIRVFFLNQDAKAAFTRSMGIEPIAYGSVFLYKNGFRIHPYGEQGDDWLALELRKGQGYARFLSKREIIGRIEAYGIQPGFTEVSSRSGGVVESDEIHQLKKLVMQKVIRRLERYVVEGIYWDTKDPDKRKTVDEIQRDSVKLIANLVGKTKSPTIDINPDLFRIVEERELSKIPDLIKNIESIKKHVPSPKIRKYMDKQVKRIRNVTKTLSAEKKKMQKMVDVIKKENLFLEKALSMDDKVALDLHHSIKISAATINGLLEKINQKILDGSSVKELIPYIDRISFENQKINAVAEIVSNANFELKVRYITTDIVAYITQYIQRILMKDSGNMTYRLINDRIVFPLEFRPIEISIMIDNLISNARKANANQITFRFSKVGKHLHIQIADNGIGVDKESAEHLFTRGFTTTTGSGLGLRHVKTIIETLGGQVKFAGNNIPGMGRGACFEVVLDDS